MIIGLLSTTDHPFCGYMHKIISAKYKIDCLLLDTKKYDDKDLKLWRERTINKIPYINILDINNSKVIYTNSHNDPELTTIIQERKIELLINCGTPRILRKETFNAPRIGVLNCHPGILPFYRGCSCVEWALYNNDPVGNTCHLMSEKIDEGKIILSEKHDVKNFKSYQAIRTFLYLNSIDLIIKSIQVLEKKDINEFECKLGGKYYHPIDEEKMKQVFERYGDERIKN